MAQPTTQTASASRASDPSQWIDRYGDYLYRFALIRVRNASVAEELVQDTLVAALQSRARFAGRSSERTWLTGILKHKVIDHFRRVSREQPTDDPASSVEELGAFDEHGGWRVHEGQAPSDWPLNPDTTLQQKEFFEALQRCVEHLPTRVAQVFVLRELEEMSTAEICKQLAVSSTNCWVMLHRARLQLRRCLERTWFGRSP